LLFAVFTWGADDDVIVLDKSNFESIVNSKDIILVEFYAPWCGHCKKLAPEYAKAAEILKKEDPAIPLAKVDADSEKELGSRFGIRSFPTMKIFRNGVESEYTGPRESAGIVSYMKKQAGPSAKNLNTEEAFKLFVEDETDVDVDIVGFFENKDSDLAKLFSKVADSLRDKFRFGIVTEKSVMEHVGHSEAIVMYRSFDEQVVVYSGVNKQDDISNWIWEKSIPLIGEITKEHTARYTRKALPIVKVAFDVNWGPNIKKTNYYVSRLAKVAELPEVKGKLLFGLVHKVSFAQEVQKFGFTGSEEFSVYIDDHAKAQKYKFTEKEFNTENVQQFVTDFLAGSLKPFLKSQPVPEQQGAVTVVVGETFNNVVLDPTKDVLFEMYAPWCGHCKKLEPIYEELAKTLKDNPNLVIAKMDATANDSPHPKYQAKGYPTILFSPAGRKDSPMPYQGDRDIKGFTAFLQKNGVASKVKKDEL